MNWKDALGRIKAEYLKINPVRVIFEVGNDCVHSTNKMAEARPAGKAGQGLIPCDVLIPQKLTPKGHCGFLR